MGQGSRISRGLLAIVLVSAVGATVPLRGPAPARAADGLYRSAAYGYSLLVPTTWVRVPDVRWTPAGPPADVTFMPPDHQAALSVLVSPTGSRTYTDADLQGVARRLLYQENEVVNSTTVHAARQVIGNATYETASIERASGQPLMLTVTYVAVTQQHHRLYALAGVVYQLVASFPPPGSGDTSPTPTPTPEGGISGNAAQRGASIALPAATPASGESLAGRMSSDPADPPPPLPTDHLRGDPCPAGSDRALVVHDKNCAAPAERQFLASVLESFAIDPHAPNDSRPAASVGIDGYTLFTDQALGFTVAFPGQWAPIPLQGTVRAVRSPDQDALDLVAVETSPVADPSEADLQAIAANAVAGVGTTTPGAISYQASSGNGVRAVTADALLVVIHRSNFAQDYARVGVVVAAYHGRIYSVLGTAIITSADPLPVLYPFFSPFTALARVYQTVVDTRSLEAGLALQAVPTLSIDSHDAI